MLLQRRNHNQGFGIILILVLAMIFVVAAGVLAQGTFSQSVLRGTARTLVNQQMQMVGEDILTEAKFFIGRSINSKDLAGGLYYRQFRQNTGLFNTTVPMAELPACQQKTNEESDFEVVGKNVELAVLKQCPTSHLDPTEHSRCGLLEIAVRVRHRDSGYTRKFKLNNEFSVSLTSLPRPLDRTTLFIKKGDKLVDGSGYTANSLIKESNSLLKDVISALEQFIKGYDKAIAKVSSSSATPAQVTQMLKATRQLCQNCKNRLSKPYALHNETKKSLGQQELCLYPAHSFSLVSFKYELDLELLSLPDRVREGRSKLEELQQRERKALAALEAYANSKPNPPTRLYELQESWCSAAEELSAQGAFILAQFNTFQQVIRPLSYQAENALEATVRSFSPEDWRSRSNVAVSTCDELNNYLESDSACSGVFFLSNQNTWVVDRVFRGRCVIVVNGDCQLNRCLVEDVSRDTITIICFGEMSVCGPVDGSVVAWNEISIAKSTTIKGTLLVNDPLRSGRVSVKGKLIRDERLIAGPSGSNGLVDTVDTCQQYVNLVPCSLATMVTR